MAESSQLGIEPVKTIGFAAITAAVGAYVFVGQLQNPGRLLLLQNLTDTTMMWSIDGVNDHIPMLPNGYIMIDICANQDLIQGLFAVKDLDIYVRYLTAGPTVGSVYATSFYAVDLAPTDFTP